MVKKDTPTAVVENSLANGIVIGSKHITIENVYIGYCAGDAIKINDGVHPGLIKNCRLHGSGGNGATISGATTKEVTFENCY